MRQLKVMIEPANTRNTYMIACRICEKALASEIVYSAALAQSEGERLNILRTKADRMRREVKARVLAGDLNGVCEHI